MSDEYELLSPFLQKYIYRHGWKELKDIQIRAIKVILRSEYHLLISSGTASGKTEAAFFPAITELTRHPSRTIGILYIGPLKALINDQFKRLEEILEKSAIPLWHWHGDVSASEKKQALKHPSGVMQITPESLESLIMRHPSDIKRLFSDLRFVIIDEVHTFMGQERGSQLLCLLQRINTLAGCNPRRIGLSATIHDYQDAKAWLQCGTDREVSLAKSKVTNKRIINVSFSQFPYQKNYNLDTFISPEEREFYQTIYSDVYGTNSILFTNSRHDAERAAQFLKEIAVQRHEDSGVFQVHHGSLSSELRKDAEEALKNPFKKTVVMATASLELGLDIGELEQVAQIGAPHSCSSYVQRLGRSGRRGNPSRMRFFCSEDSNAKESFLDEIIPWDLLKLIAILELYGKSEWIEPFESAKKPFSLLYHQTMSVLYASGGMDARDLAHQILSLSSFSAITKDEYRILLKHLIHIGHIERLADDSLRVGLENERMVNHYSFLAIFEEKHTFRVVMGKDEIGTIENYSQQSPYLVLGGKSWRILKTNTEKRIIEVEPVESIGKIAIWHGSSIPVHTEIVKMMRSVLLSDTIYEYLDENARKRLNEARVVAKKYDIGNSLVFPHNGKYYILPWIGTLELDTLYREIKFGIGSKFPIAFGCSGTYYITVNTEVSASCLCEELYALRQDHCDPYSLVDPEEEPYYGKYSYFIPRELRVEELVTDRIRQNFVYL